jgi:hypothetical protein
MILTKTLTKKLLESLIEKNFKNLGYLSCSPILDSIKLLGFDYATASGISINIEDLNTPLAKKKILNKLSTNFQKKSLGWFQGSVSETERFQSILDEWAISSEILKDDIISFSDEFDPLNNLFIMAFSGARGNMTQVRQIVGIRGLMTDQEGNVIDLPIKSNFREGLTSTDYFVSSYGARKGVVDTALKTADAGYLTRRLIYLAQDMIIKYLDCGTENGINIYLDNKTEKVGFFKLIGRTLIGISKENKKNLISFKKNIIDEDLIDEFKNHFPLIVKIRSALTCKSLSGICQKCYGWDLATREKILFGENIGIVAAQSIGEPGTQLTMRTFHTGGIFTTQFAKKNSSPFSGNFYLPLNYKSSIWRTPQGDQITKVDQTIRAKIVSIDGDENFLTIPAGSMLYVNESGYIYKGQTFFQAPEQTNFAKKRKIKPILVPFDGELKFHKVKIKKYSNKKYKIIQQDAILWLASGKVYPVPKESEAFIFSYLNKNKAFARTKLVSKISGLCYFDKKANVFSIINKTKKITLSLNTFSQISYGTKLEIKILIKNCQFIDSSTIFAYIYYFPNCQEKIYSVRKLENLNKTTFCFITQSDIWQHFSDTINNTVSNKKITLTETKLNQNTILLGSGNLIKKDGFHFIFRKIFPIFLAPGSLIYKKNNEFVLKNQKLASSLVFKEVHKDIVQGLPKIEDIIEARKIENSSYLSNWSGIFLKHWSSENCKSIFAGNGYVSLNLKMFNPLNFELKKIKTKKKYIAKQGYYCNFLEYPYKIGSLPPEEDANSLEEQEDDEEDKSLDDLSKKDLESLLYKYWPKRILKFCSRRKIKNIFRKEYNYVQIATGAQFTSRARIVTYNNTLYLLEKLHWTNLTFEENSSKPYFFPKNESFLSYDRKQILKIKYKFLKNYSFKRDIPENWYYFLENLGWVKIKEVNADFFIMTEKELSFKEVLSKKLGQFIDTGMPLSKGRLDPHKFLHKIFLFQTERDGLFLGTHRSLLKLHFIMIKRMQEVYQSQSVMILDKHIELIIRSLTSKVLITETILKKEIIFYENEIISLSLIDQLLNHFSTFKNSKFVINKLFYYPLILGSSKSGIQKSSFLSSAGFQETKMVLTKCAIEGKKDWIRGLKESVIIGRLLPAGTSFFNYKSSLDNLIFYKKNTR